MFKRKKSGEVATILIVTTCVVVGLVARAFAGGKVKYPDFKAKEKTVDTVEHPAVPEWDR